MAFKFHSLVVLHKEHKHDRNFARKHSKKSKALVLAILGPVRLGYSGIRIYSGIYSSYSAPGSRIGESKSRYSGMRIAPRQTLTRMHYSNYTYSGLIPNERTLNHE